MIISLAHFISHGSALVFTSVFTFLVWHRCSQWVELQLQSKCLNWLTDYSADKVFAASPLSPDSSYGLLLPHPRALHNSPFRGIDPSLGLIGSASPGRKEVCGMVVWAICAGHDAVKPSGKSFLTCWKGTSALWFPVGRRFLTYFGDWTQTRDVVYPQRSRWRGSTMISWGVFNVTQIIP